MRKAAGIILLSFIVLTHVTNFAYAQTATATPTPTDDEEEQAKEDKKNDLEKEINKLEKKIDELQGEQKSLSSQIEIADSQISVSELKIANTESKISELNNDIEITEDKIKDYEGSLSLNTHALINRVTAIYEVGKVEPWQILFTSKNIQNFITRLTYLKILQSHDKKMVLASQQAKVNYANTQQILGEKVEKELELREELSQYNDQLESDRIEKQRLLEQTQGSEARYQKLLEQAKAQLAGFGRFVTSQGGASILSGQTNCDDWGCYYNQRDSQWGNNSLNGTQYSLASDGCLVTAMAMIYTHYGYNVNPQDINSNSLNFASYYPAYLLFTITAGGKTTQRVGAQIDSAISGGDPVVVGVNAYGGTHFVVIKSGSNGDYKMHDPFVPNGHDINFTDHYSMSSIFSVQKVVFL